ncbi:MAG: hypothetical protein UZ15_CFX003000735 [Chloroflexi bacterium OLB15]|nr:MAG: hypothetical protein UZ15_CFX003000735 [Chloroflexi bacterium OLB15]
MSEDTEMQQRAANLRDRIAAENGVTRAVEVVRRYLEQ